MKTNLTDKQAAALAFLRDQGPGGRYRGVWVSIPKVAEATGRPAEGAGQTLASLYRKGLVERERMGGRVYYRAAPSGEETK